MDAAATTLAIKLDSPGPILFRQPRVGFNGRTFELWKFRSMFSEKTDLHASVQTRRNDPRVTRVGRFIRGTSIDELPQLFNVLRGDMSIVGPRPHALSTRTEGHNLEELVDYYAVRHRVKPGMTGWAQVQGFRGELDTLDKLQNRVDCDLYYIDNWTFWLDIDIVVRTLMMIFRDKRAY
ncbi:MULTISPECIES: sugar transferase [Methylosinus]|uniref:sugar transferase n=1 Tax=Methylosinus TaxID=425 RepID=UPI0001D2E3AD|nr:MULTISPECIES: sugar transferase [Methylosinus]